MNLNTNFSNPHPSSLENVAFTHDISSSESSPPEIPQEQTSLEEPTPITSSIENESNTVQTASVNVFSKQNYENETIQALSQLISLSLRNPKTYEVNNEEVKKGSLAEKAYLAGRVAQPVNETVNIFLSTLETINSVETIDTLSSFLQETDKIINGEVFVISQARVGLHLKGLHEKVKKLKDCESKIDAIRDEIKALKNTNPSDPKIQNKENELIALLKERKELVTQSYKNLVTYSLKAASIDSNLLSMLVSKFSKNPTTINCFALLAGTLGSIYHGYKVVSTISDLIDNNQQADRLIKEIKMNNEIIEKKEIDPSIKKTLELRNKNLDVQYADNGVKTTFNSLILGSYSTALSSGALAFAGKVASFLAIGAAGAAMGAIATTVSLASGIFFVGGISIGAAYLGYKKKRDIRLGINYKLAERKLIKENLKIQDNLRIKNLYQIQLKNNIRDLKLSQLQLKYPNKETIQMRHLKNQLKNIDDEINSSESKQKYFNDLSKLTQTKISKIEDLEKVPMKKLISANKLLYKVPITDQNRVNHKLLANSIYYSIELKKEKKEIRDLQNKIEGSKIMIKKLEQKVRIIEKKIDKSDQLINNIFKSNVSNAREELVKLKKNYEMQKFATEFNLSSKELNEDLEMIHSLIQKDENANLKQFLKDSHINVDLFDIDPALSILEYCRKKAA